MKDINYYKSLDFDIKIEKETVDGEEYFIAYCDELGKKSCYGTGNTPEEALLNFKNDKEEFIELLYDNKKIIPEPKGKDEEEYSFSGFFNVRTSTQMHAMLSKQAKKMGISLNLYVNQILASSSNLNETKEYFDEKIKILEEKIEEFHSNIIYNFTEYRPKTFTKKMNAYIAIQPQKIEIESLGR